MKLLAYVGEARHHRDADLAAEKSYEVHEPGEGTRVGEAVQCTCFEGFKDDAANESHIATRKRDRQDKFDDLKAASIPRGVEVRGGLAGNRADG